MLFSDPPNMAKKAESQICSSLCFFKALLLFVAFLIPSLVFTCFSSSGFFPFQITIPILILSTIFVVKFTKKKRAILVENPVQAENPKILPEEELEEATKQCNAAQGSEVDSQIVSPDLQSDSESSNESVVTENLELDWMCSNNEGQSGTISNDSVSEDDEDSLIEISLPCGDSNGLIEEPKQKRHQKLPNFLSDSIFRQEELMELLADINEVNEEENLIEIDISMGSIKCSTLEIEA